MSIETWAYLFAVAGVAVPFVGAIVLPFTTRSPNTDRLLPAIRRISLVACWLTLLLVLVTAATARQSERSAFMLSGLQSGFALLTAAVWLPVMELAVGESPRRPVLFFSFLLALEGALLGIFLIDDGLLFAMFLEVGTLLTYLLLALSSPGEEDAAATRFLLFNLAADALILTGLVGMMVAHARVSPRNDHGTVSFSTSISAITTEFPRMTVEDEGAQEYWNHARRWLLTALILGFAIKMPLVPFHNWFSTAISQAPPCVALAMVTAGLRIGIFGLVRIFAPVSADLGDVQHQLIGLTALGALYCGLLALSHEDTRKLTAAAALCYLAIAAAAVFGSHPVVATVLALGSASAFALFYFALAWLEMRYDAREISALSGAVSTRGNMPQTSALLVVAVLAVVGVPGLPVFPGLFAALGALFDISWSGAFFAILATLLVAWALFWMLQRALFGGSTWPRPLVPNGNEAPGGVTGAVLVEGDDLRRGALWTLLPLCILSVAAGIRPQSIINWLLAAAGGSTLR